MEISHHKGSRWEVKPSVHLNEQFYWTGKETKQKVGKWHNSLGKNMALLPQKQINFVTIERE